jgi:hypothetical protein
MENTLEHINVLGEYGKNILPYTEHTPVNIKLSLSRRIFNQYEKKSDPNLSLYIIDWAKKTTHATVPLKGFN